MSATSEYRRALFALADEMGFTVDYTKGRHVRLRAANGAVVICSGSPGNPRRTLRNVRADLRRALRTGTVRPVAG